MVNYTKKIFVSFSLILVLLLGMSLPVSAFSEDKMPTNVLLKGTCESRLTTTSGFLETEVSLIRINDNTFSVDVNYPGIGESMHFEFTGKRLYDNYYTLTGDNGLKGGIWTVDKGGVIEFTFFIDGGLNGPINWLETKLYAE